MMGMLEGYEKARGGILRTGLLDKYALELTYSV